MEDAKKLIERNLTLTSVVFELEQFGNKCGKSRTFNFNKCCIWIGVPFLAPVIEELFNFNKCCIWM